VIIVTGASGLLGMSLMLTAHDRGSAVTGLFNTHSIALLDVDSEQADLTDHSSVRRLVQRLSPDWIVHCASLTAVDWCEDHPAQTHAVNVEATGNLAIAARDVGARFVYISTDSVFDGVKGEYRESDQTSPLNVYASSKLQGEQAVMTELPDSLLLRTNIYGWNAQEKQSLSEWSLNRLVNGDTVPGFMDVTFCPILVNDLSDVILDLMETNSSGLFHAVGSESCTKYEFARQIATAFGFDLKNVLATSIDDLNMQAQRPKNTSMLTEKLCGVLGRSMPDVHSGLLRLKHLQESGFVSRLKSAV
jgi:dTDP-4-dehydrorhamnose reductase